MFQASSGNAVVSLRFKGLIRRLIPVFLTGLWLVSIEAFAAQLPQRWRWSNPAPFGGNIYDMAYGLGLTVAVTERGGIHTSEDLIFWEPRDSHTSNALRAVTFLGNRLVIAGERGTVLYADSLLDFRLVHLGTEDWLEGLAASTNLLVAVGDNGAIYTSGNGTAWSRQTSAPAITAWLSAVAYGQGNFVTVGENGFIATSPNGTNWTKRISNTSRYLYRVGWAQNQFLAVGEGGLLLSSLNGGLNWSQVSNVGSTGALYGATGTLESQAVVGDGELRLRSPGSPWSNELDPAKSLPAPRWTYFNALWEGSLYFVSGRSGMMVEGFQTNAIGPFVWIDRTRPIRNWLWELHRTPELYVTVGYRGTVMTSVNGIDWSIELVPPSATNSTFLGVGGTTNLLLAVGDRGRVILSPNTFTNLVQTNLNGTLSTNSVSTLGIFWHAITPPTTNDLQGVAVFNDQFVLTGDFGTVLTSPDGTNWTRRTTPTANFLTGVAAFPAGLVAVGRGGTLLTSSDGISWTNHPTGTTNWLYRARHVDGRLIVVGQNGTILTSPDAVTWTRQTSPTTRWLNDVTRLDDTFFIVGTQGAVLASSNAVEWISIGTITDKSLYGVACHGGQLVAAGVEGVIVRSQVIPDLTPVRLLNFSRHDNQNLYLFAGRPDQRFTLDRSLTLTNWTPGPKLEFLDSTGTLLLLENAVTNAPPTEFYRATIVP
jgi:hypothetical protein